ncbi:hypothetical protein Nepgr_030385 [Nepenthes gracilis]|uniref:TLDc domain-containing protein n=1 Tax=Nepenthes gracilis TaxID=150966 RepID=A0AAD3Y3U5_NEPGR|nr:hypothetical protein Nepgr_030385 [Nepenthes gracilis]
MFSWKEKVTEKLSRILADSPSSPPPALDSPQGSTSSRERSPFSSIFSSILSSASHDAHNVKENQDDFKQAEALPVVWSGDTTSWRCENLDIHVDHFPAYANKEAHNPHKEYDTHSSAMSTSGSEIYEDTVDPQSPLKLMPNLTEDSSFISVELYEFLHCSLPNIVKGCQWVLLYSTLRHGISLRTLIRKSSDLSGPCLLIVGDMKGAVFGGLLECPLKPSEKRKYQGTNQTFVFTTIYGVPRLFRPTGANRYFYLCMDDLLAFGGGGSFALSLDEDLLSGSSGPCETFGNECLAHDPEFELKNVELWGFTHSSRYLP